MKIAKESWFANDLRISTMLLHGQVLALPKIEVSRGLEYLKRLENATTLDQAQAIFQDYSADPNRPKFLPSRIVNFMDEPDYLDELIERSSSGALTFLNQDEIKSLSNEALFDLVKEQKFSLLECPIYRDETDTLVIYSQPSIWTDNWIPIEIADAIGVPDNGYGLDYYPAEFIYNDINKFETVFKRHGFEIIIDDVELLRLSGQISV